MINVMYRTGKLVFSGPRSVVDVTEMTMCIARLEIAVHIVVPKNILDKSSLIKKMFR